jgi:hypothetical protein
MAIHYDDKGKFFTDLVMKEARPVLIQTLTHRIQGNFYVRPGVRIKDQINQEEMFLALTEASVYDLSGEELYHCDFLLVNRAHLIWLLPEDQGLNPEYKDKGATT